MTKLHGMDKAREGLKITIEGFIENAWEMIKTPGVKDTDIGKRALRERKELIQDYIKDCRVYQMDKNLLDVLTENYNSLKRGIDRIIK